MAAASIDTYRIVKRLREAGFTDAQAETVTDVIRDTHQSALGDLATKGDIRDVRAEIKDVRAEIQTLRGDMEGGFRAIRVETQLLEQRMTIKLGSMLVVGIGVVAAVVKLL